MPWMHLCSRLGGSGHGLAAVAACFDTCHALSDSPSRSSSGSSSSSGSGSSIGLRSYRRLCSLLSSRFPWILLWLHSWIPHLFSHFSLAVSVAPWRWVFAVRLFSCPVSTALTLVVRVRVPACPRPCCCPCPLLPQILSRSVVVWSCSCGPAVVCCAFIKRHLRLPLPPDDASAPQSSHLWGSYTGGK